MRYRLRTLLILLAIDPPVLAGIVWPPVRAQYVTWQWREAVRSAKTVRVYIHSFTAEDRIAIQVDDDN